MKRTEPITPPGFAKVRGEKGRIFYKILHPIHLWLYSLHKDYIASLNKPMYMSPIECVRPHLKRRFLLKLDLKNAFDSVTAHKANRYADVYFEQNGEYFFS